MALVGMLQSCAGLIFAFALGAAHANPVTHWNRVALQLADEANASMETRGETFAALHTALFEVLNFIEGSRYPARHLVPSPRQLHMSHDAAAAGAAHTVLSAAHPKHRRWLDRQLELALQTIPAGVEKNSGVIAGRELGRIVHALRQAPPRATRAIGDPLRWNAIVADLASASRRDALDTAWIHMHVATALAAATDAESAHRVVRATLDQQFGRLQVASAIERRGSAYVEALAIGR